MERRVPTPDHKRLNIFVGKWNTEGVTKTNPVANIKAVDTYEWLSGGFFLLHRWDARVGDMETKGIEIIGYDVSSQNYTMNSFDDQGTAGVMQLSVHNGIWTFKGEFERSTVVYSEDGNIMTGKWENSSDGINWFPWMDVKLTKIN